MNLVLLEQILTDLKQPAFRFKQAREAIEVNLISSWSEAASLPADLKDKLSQLIPISSLELAGQAISKRGDTTKVAFKLHDNKTIETVLMRHEDGRNTVCVSTQAGCPMRCTFCATGTMGFFRNLSSEEIVDQVMHFARMLKIKDQAVNNVVLMGMGEPMHNYDAVMAALRTLNDRNGFNLGARHMSISTCGIVAGILRLANEPLQINLAISLHAPNDLLRSKIMPVNRVYPIAKLMSAVSDYVKKTNRKVFFEYLLIDNLNDTPATAIELAELVKRPLFHVNLIKYHSTGAFKTSPRSRRENFMKILKDRGVSVTHRISFGEDILAACGQLANNL